MKRRKGLEMWGAPDEFGFGLRDFLGGIVFFLGLFLVLLIGACICGVVTVGRRLFPRKSSSGGLHRG